MNKEQKADKEMERFEKLKEQRNKTEDKNFHKEAKRQLNQYWE